MIGLLFIVSRAAVQWTLKYLFNTAFSFSVHSLTFVVHSRSVFMYDWALELVWYCMVFRHFCRC